MLLRTLGELRQGDDAGPERRLRRKPLALLCYLARRAPRAVSRTELATLFWGERGEERARQSLRQALTEIKHALGDAIDVDADSVRLAPDAVQLDVTLFEQDAAAGRAREAIDRWTGDFFEAGEDIGGDGFRRWVEGERATLHQRYRLAMERLLGDAAARGDWAGAAHLAERWTHALPLDEQAHLRLVEAYRMSARSAEALAVHGAFVHRLRAHDETEPSPAFLRLGTGLAEEARAELARQGHGSAAVHEPDLVGRAAIMRELDDAWTRASGGTPAVVVMRGEPGSGRTRCCNEFARRVGTRGVVLQARATASAPRAFASQLFDGIRHAAGSAGAAPEALAEVARLVPALASQFPHLPAASRDAGALPEAVAQVLAAIGEEQPVLVVADDLHAADGPSIQLVTALAPRLDGHVMLLVTEDESEALPAASLATLLSTRGHRRLQLNGLGLAEVESMLGSMVSMDAAPRHQLATRLRAETAGSPHDISALVATLIDDHLLSLDATGKWQPATGLGERALPVPSVVRDRARARLDQLSVSARHVAEGLALHGEPVEPASVSVLTGIAPDETDAALRELTDRRLLQEATGSPGRVAFPSPLVRRAVATLVPPTRRLALQALGTPSHEGRTLAAVVPARSSSLGAVQSAGAPVAGTRSRRLVVTGVAALAIAAATLAFRDQLFSPGGAGASHGEPPVIALGRIVDYRESASSDLTKPLTDMLATNLGRVRRLRVLSSARMYELANQRRRSDTSAPDLMDAARRAGATELVGGALYSTERGGFRLDLQRVVIATGSITNTHSVSGRTIFELADSGTARLAADFGESTPAGSIADVTTRSVSAYRLYEEGLRLYVANDLRAAEPLFEAALKEDSTFAMAAYYSALAASEAHVSLRRFRNAARLATRTSDRERLTILARLAFIASDPSLPALADTLVVRYPLEVDGYFYTGLSLMVAGRFLGAVEPFNRIVAMDSATLSSDAAKCDACAALRQIVSAYQLADSLPAAEREARRWLRLQPRSGFAWVILADVLSQRGKFADAMQALDQGARFDEGRREGQRLLHRAVQASYAGDFDRANPLFDGEINTGSPARDRQGHWYRGISMRAQGRLNAALEDGKSHRAMSLSLYPRGVGARRRAAPLEALPEAQVLFEMGRYRAAAALFDSVSRWSVGDESESQIAHARSWYMTHATSALILNGDTARVGERIDSIEAIGRNSNLGRDKNLHHHVRGLLLAARGQHEAAILELRKAIYSWNFGYTRTNMALAASYLKVNRADSAIRVLQPALRGSVEASNFYVARTDVHELLGQAWDLIGTAAARDSAAAHYEEVVRAWKNADASFGPRLARVKERLAMLRRPG